MENSKGSSGIGNFMYSGNQFLLRPQIPFPNNVSQAYVDYEPNPAISAKHVQIAREGNTLHHHTSSENFVIEEQPSWLDDLLNEPETPVRRGRGGHRRSSSDSVAYLNSANLSNLSYADNDEFKFRNLVSTPSWSTKNFDHGKDARYKSPYAEMNSGKLTNRAWDSSLTNSKHLGTIHSGKDNVAFQSSGLACPQHESDGVPSAANENHDSVESSHQEVKLSSEKKDSSNAKSAASEIDTKRAKQQFAQRSRVRKLQYIAELERNVQALQVEGSGVSAELEFLNQQNLILNMENKALKQRLENVAQEQLIKYLEQEVLEREIGRLRSLYQQQQHQLQQSPQQPISSHWRKKSRDHESEFANLSLKHKDSNSGRDHMTGALRI